MMKITLKEAVDSMDQIAQLATRRMAEGTEKYGEEMVEDPFMEFEEECADAFNYITLAYIKVKRGWEREQKRLRLVRSERPDNRRH